MKKILMVLLGLIFIAGCSQSKQPQKAAVKAETVVVQKQALAAQKQPSAVQGSPQTGEFEPFAIYSDKNVSSNHFIPSGWMGDYSDIKFNDGWPENPHSGATCIKIEYSNKATNGARWAGVYWQYPQNNWGNKEQSYNLKGAKKLTFWVRGEKGGEQIQEFKFGGISGEYPDSDGASIGPLTLTNEWKQYTIDLSGKDLSHIIGGFAWATNIDVNPDGAVFYLDDIKYE